MPTSDSPDTIQLRTLALRSGRTVPVVRTLLRAAGVKPVDGGHRMYASTKVNVDEALAALGVQANETTTPSTAAPDLAQLAKDSAAAVEKIPTPTPATKGTGNEDDPIPQEILEGSVPAGNKPFPMPTHPRPDMYYWPINTNPNRQNAMLLRGWRFVTDDKHIAEIRPDGLYSRMRVGNRVRHMDLELAVLPRAVFDRMKVVRNEGAGDHREAVDEGYKANVEAAQRALRGKLGAGGDRHIGAVEFDDAEAEDRGNFDRAKKAGAVPSRVVIHR